MTVVPAARAVRPDAGLYRFDRRLSALGLGPVAGVDEAGRGACAGPLVVAAVILPLRAGREVPELADSKLLSPATRDEVLQHIERCAIASAVVVVPSTEVDLRGLHVTNLEGMRRAVARLVVRPGYVLTDGFAVDGLHGLGMWKGDRVSANVAAASVLAKVTRDRLMVLADRRWPGYGFAEHKGYCTSAHQEALDRLGPCAWHRRSFANVGRIGVAADDTQEAWGFALEGEEDR
jgi:ribonuclease HII